PISWDVGRYTGLPFAADSQRGFRDADGNSAFQLRCTEAGFFINSATFTHAAPLVGEGPNVSIARDLFPPIAAFAGGASVVIDADVRIPWVHSVAPPLIEGTAQVSLGMYLRDRTTGTVLGWIVNLFDNRPAGVNGSGIESLGHDGVNAFVSTPLARTDALGRAVRFVTAPQWSCSMQHVTGWSENRHCTAIVTHANMAAALAALRETGLRISAEPADIDLSSFGFGGEVIVGTARVNDVSLGASVANLTLRRQTPPQFSRR
ncbi:MAG TPA: hypothetical protein VMZ74_06625, partial [Ramlibacter sp.]|nr:hypothetical protein [Ramlibacter sp.]